MVGKVTVDSDKCKCLGRCVQSCPQEVFAWNFKTQKAEVVNEIECFTCYNCMEVCKFNAIKVVDVDWKPVQKD